MSELTISRETKSKAYIFVKSLMKDGADGGDVHELISAISEKISPDIAGTILFDLISNVRDENTDIVCESTWFGPVSMTFFKWIANDWSEYCEETDIRGTFSFGSAEEWKSWNKQQTKPCSDSEIKDSIGRAASQICVFKWWADPVSSSAAKQFINDLYNNINQRIDEDADDKKKKKKK